MTQASPTADGASRSAAVLMVAQGLVLIVLTGILVRDAIQGDVGSTTQALTEGGLVLVFAAIAGWLAWGLATARAWARTPSLVWNLLLVPVAFSMMGAGQWVMGGAVLLVAAASILMVWRTPVPDDDA